jgi:hypothetical protein
MYTPYEVIKWWLPIVSAFGLVIKAYTSTKAGIAEFVDRLLSNHLTHIETATVSNAEEAKKTNELLRDHAGKLDMVQATLNEQHGQNIIAYQGLLEGLTILKERTRACNKVSKSRSKRNG